MAQANQRDATRGSKIITGCRDPTGSIFVASFSTPKGDDAALRDQRDKSLLPASTDLRILPRMKTWIERLVASKRARTYAE
ncbi:hypothetical protein IG631_02239 [Alternaria alternata]|nr:hypothetical protein IG631_02239 [Alternaria alternata]